MVLCGGFADKVRAKKMRQDGGAEFISASLRDVCMKKGLLHERPFRLTAFATSPVATGEANMP